MTLASARQSISPKNIFDAVLKSASSLFAPLSPPARIRASIDAYEAQSERIVGWIQLAGVTIFAALYAATFSSFEVHQLVSGTYYVRTPPGSAGLKFEDPRLERFMAAPPRRRTARRELRSWVVVPARAGRVVLFESWLRHEVPASRTASERVSISFNYGLR